MLVKLLKSRAGAGWKQEPGETAEVGYNEGVRMIEAQQAVPVVEDQRETATITPPEVRAKKKAASKKKRRSNR